MRLPTHQDDFLNRAKVVTHGALMNKKLLTEKSVIVAKFYTYGAFKINRVNRFSIVFHLFCCNKHELSTTPLGNVASLACFFHVSNVIKKLLISLFYFISLCHLRLDDHYGIR